MSESYDFLSETTQIAFSRVFLKVNFIFSKQFSVDFNITKCVPKSFLAQNVCLRIISLWWVGHCYSKIDNVLLLFLRCYYLYACNIFLLIYLKSYFRPTFGNSSPPPQNSESASVMKYQNVLFFWFLYIPNKLSRYTALIIQKEVIWQVQIWRSECQHSWNDLYMNLTTIWNFVGFMRPHEYVTKIYGGVYYKC